MEKIGQSLDIEQLKSWLNFYSQKSGIEIIFSNDPNLIAGIDTSDLKNPKLYLNLENISQKYNLSLPETLAVLFHEVEHLKEDIQLRSTQEWEKVYQQRKAHIASQGIFAPAYHLLENALRDIFVNKQVISPRNAPALQSDMYKLLEKTYWDGNLLDSPKHYQFSFAILREAFFPQQKCILAPDIRKVIDRLKRNQILHKATHWTLKERLEILQEYIEPIYRKFLEEDLKQLQKEENSQQNNQEKANEENSQTCNSSSCKNSQQTTNSQTSGDLPNEIDNQISWNPFENWEKQFPHLPHVIEDNLSDEEKQQLEEAIEKVIEEKKEQNKPKSQKELELEQRAKSILWWDASEKDIEKVKRKLEEYNNFLKKLEQIQDSETWKPIIDEIVSLFEKIKSKREKPRYQYKWPVDQELWVWLDSAFIASWVAQLLSWNPNPEMFEREIIKQKEQNFVWKFELTLITDGSGSMEWEKNRQQKIAFLLIFEALKRLVDRLSLAKTQLQESLDIVTEGLMFTGSWVETIKEASNDMTDKDRLEAFGILDYAGGWMTNDYDAIKKVLEDIENRPYQDLQDIKQWKIKKIVIVLSDWWSSNPYLMKKNIQNLRGKWVIVYGIWITSAGRPVVDLYSWGGKKLGFGQVCKKPQDLAKVLKDLLKEHLEKI